MFLQDAFPLKSKEMLYHPDVWLRLEALKLGCKLLEDADLNLQAAFRKWLGSKWVRIRSFR